LLVVALPVSLIKTVAPIMVSPFLASFIEPLMEKFWDRSDLVGKHKAKTSIR
jgi:hypothetical protein